MKLRTLAVAILAASTATVSVSTFAAAHEKTGVSLSGMVRAEYDNDSESLTTKVELNLDASAEANGITYFGHAQLEGNGLGGANKATLNAAGDTIDSGKSVTTDDIYVGMKGGFGKVTIGDTDNGCDATDVGGFPDERYGSVATAGCSGGDQNNITYVGSAGAVSYAASFSPENNEDNFSIGANAKFGAATVSLGHTAAGDNGTDATVLGLAGAFGPVSVGLRASDVEDIDDALVQVHAKYAAGANTFVVGIADVGDTNPVQAYWTRDLGANTLFRLELQDTDIDGDDTDVALRLQHNF